MNNYYLRLHKILNNNRIIIDNNNNNFYGNESEREDVRVSQQLNNELFRNIIIIRKNDDVKGRD